MAGSAREDLRLLIQCPTCAAKGWLPLATRPPEPPITWEDLRIQALELPCPACGARIEIQASGDSLRMVTCTGQDLRIFVGQPEEVGHVLK